MTARPDGDLLIGVARVFADPLAIGMRAERVRAVGRQLAADFGVANDARRQRDVQVEQIAGGAAVQHEARVGDGRLMLGRRFDLGGRQSPAPTQPDVQLHLVEDGSEPRLSDFHVGERAALVGGERIGARKLDQEQIILHQIHAKRRFRQSAIAQLPDEVVIDIAGPFVSGGSLEAIEDVHVSDRVRDRALRRLHGVAPVDVHAHAHLGDAANAGHWFSPLNRTVPQTTLGNLAARATRYCGGRLDAMMGAPVERTSAG